MTNLSNVFSASAAGLKLKHEIRVLFNLMSDDIHMIVIPEVSVLVCVSLGLMTVNDSILSPTLIVLLTSNVFALYHPIGRKDMQRNSTRNLAKVPMRIYCFISNDVET